MTRIRGLAPIVYPDSKVLILGSMPSEKSLELGQYYGHKTNHFWKILSDAFKQKEPQDYPAKKTLLRKTRIALWDVMRSCTRVRSSDDSIGDVAVNNIPAFLKKYPTIQFLLLNGGAAACYFHQRVAEKIAIPFYEVPSTSARNARLDLRQKIDLWRRKLKS